MNDGTLNILIVQHSSSRDGSTISGLLLANGLRDAGFDTHVAFGHDGQMIDVYRAQAHTVYVVEHKNWMRRAHPLRFVRDAVHEARTSRPMRALINRIQPDVVYVNTSVSLAGALAARRAGVPIVWHLRELFADVGGEMNAPASFRPVIRAIIDTLADVLVAPSTALADNMLGPRAGRVHIVPNAAGEEYFDRKSSADEARETFGLPQESVVIGVPGMLRPVKGHEFLLRAITPLLRKRNEICVAVTGTGEPEYVSGLQELVDELGITEKVRFLDVVKDMPAFYRSCDVICIPSESESFGRTVIEAMACRVPVVATNVGGIPEIIQDNATGLLVAFGDERGLRKAMSQLLDEPDKTQRMIDAAFDRAKEMYHERAYQDRLAAIVKNCVSTEQA